MSSEDVIRDLCALQPSMFITRYLINGVPYIFSSEPNRYPFWRHMLAQRIEVDPDDIYIVGSASLGLSLNPDKNFKSFDENSDIDIAVISSFYFEQAWMRLLEPVGFNDARIHKAINDHVTKYIYWGTIATDRILQIMPFASKWVAGIAETKKSFGSVDLDRNTNFRIYKNLAMFRRYQTLGVRSARNNLTERKAQEK